jgi:hypothetical protein
MTARISLFAAVMAVALWACDTERNVAPVYKTYYSKYYGEDGNQTAVDLAIGSDGAMVMVGSSQSQTSDVKRSFIVKTDQEGTVLWQRPMGGDNEVPVDVEFDSHNDILVVSNVSASTIRVTRINASGAGVDSVLIEAKNGQTSVPITGKSITELSDGNLIVVGSAGASLIEENKLDGPDADDLLIYRILPTLKPTDPQELLKLQGGEHVGKIVKLFESRMNGPARYYSLGDSDRPFGDGGVFRQTFEVLQYDQYFVSAPTVPGPVVDVLISSEAVAMPVAMDEGYLMVGSTGARNSNNRQIYVAQYVDGRPTLTQRFARPINTSRSAEGVSVTYGEQGSIFVLADELQDNNNHDIYLVKLQSDGKGWEDVLRLGSVEGDDRAAAVRVLPDQRVAVFGTIEVETQTKMMLTLVSPRGTFSE